MCSYNISKKTEQKRRKRNIVYRPSPYDLLEKRKEQSTEKNKKEGALKRAEDAFYIDTSALTIDKVCEIILSKIQK